MKWRADPLSAIFLPALMLAGCGVAGEDSTSAPDSAVSQRFVAAHAVSDAKVKIGEPYQAHGARYTPADAPGYDEVGYASWYGDELRGEHTANGERFNPDGISAAHRTLPMPSYVEITALDTGRTILARVNDRGPFAEDRLIDLSQGAARQLGISGHGHAAVRVRRVQPVDTEKALLRAGQKAAERAPGSPMQLAALRRRLGPTRFAELGNVTRQARLLPTIGTLPRGSAWYVQLAAFSSRERALGMSGRSGARADPAGGVYRVRYGPFTTHEAAKQALRSANAKGYPEARILPDSVR